MKINQLYPGMFIHFGKCSAAEKMEMADLLSKDKVKLPPKYRQAMERVLMANDIFFLQWHVPGCYDADAYPMVSDAVGAKELSFEEFKMRFLGLQATSAEEDAVYESREKARLNSGFYPGLCTPLENAEDAVQLLQHLYDKYGFTAPIPKHNIAGELAEDERKHCLILDDEIDISLGVIPEFQHSSREHFLKMVAGELPITGRDLMHCATAMRNAKHSRSGGGQNPLEEFLKGLRGGRG